MPDVVGTDGDDGFLRSQKRVADKVFALAGDDVIQASTGGDAYDGGAGFDTLWVHTYNSLESGIEAYTGDRAIVLAGAAVLDNNVAYPDNFTADIPGIEHVRFETTTGFAAPGFLTTLVVGADFAGTVEFLSYVEGARTVLGGSVGDDFFYLHQGTHQVDGGPGNDVLIYERSKSTRIADVDGAVQIDSFGTGTDFSVTPLYRTVVRNVEPLIIAGTAGRDPAPYLYDARSLSRPIEYIARYGGTYHGGSDNDIFTIDATNTVDVLHGMELHGGPGADLFRLAGDLHDRLPLTIADFGPDDRLDFAYIASDTLPMVFLGTGAFTGRHNEVRYFYDGAGAVVVEFDHRFSRGSITLQGDFTLEQVPGTTLLRLGTPEIRGTAGDDALVGTAGNDVLRSFAGADSLAGGAGNDVLHGGPGADALNGGDGIDTANYENEAGGVFVNLTLGRGYTNSAFDDAYTSIENVIGTDYNDFIIGDPGMNRLDGAGGNDTIIGAVGADAIVGGAGLDWASYEDNSGVVFINLTLRRGYNNAAEGDTYDGIEHLIGGLMDDFFIGDEGANRLNGAMGADTLLGAGGADVFMFTYAPGATSTWGAPNVDLILDFASGIDTIELASAAFPGLALGVLPAAAFVLGTAAADASDRIVYDQASGRLWFDPDGTGGQAAMLFATLGESSHPAIAASDFVVV